MRQRFRGKHNEEEKKQPHDGEGEHMEALPSAAKLYVNTFMHSLDLTYGFVKLLVHPPPPPPTVCTSSNGPRGGYL